MKTKTCILAILLAGGLINSHAQDTWTQKADFGGTARFAAAGFSISSKGYIGTGYDGILKKDFWEYDPTTNTWIQIADFAGTGRSNAAGFSINSKGYIGDGYNGTYTNEFWAYNSTTNAWTQKARFPGTQRQYEVGFSIGSKGYIGTGYDDIAPFKKDFWEYDPSTNAWTQKADFGGGGRSLAVGFGIGSKGYIGTGNDAIGYYNDLWEYDPAANTWTQKANFGGTARNWAVGFSIGSKGYIGTGVDGNGTYYNDLWEYDPDTNAWTQKADFGGTARYRAVGFSIGSKGYIGTGTDGNGTFYKDFWEYTPATAQTNPVPLISQPLVPDAIAPGGAGFTLTVNGTGFVTGSVVNWNGSARATTFVTSSQLTASILASDIATASTATVTVFNPSSGGGPSNIVFLSITTPTGIPAMTRSEYAAAGVSPLDIIAADFNSDGKLDVAAANQLFGSTVSVLLGNGDGTMQPLVQYAAGNWPISPVSADFNGDGKPDLAVPNYNSDDDLSVFIGNGDGTFQQQVRYAAGSNPASLVTADFNGDGKLDLIVANCRCFDPGESTVSVLLGNGDGTFQPQRQYDAGDTPIFLGAGDFNRDGKLDLVVANYYTGMVSVLLGNGDGTFQQPVAYAAGVNPYGLEIADFSGDGKLDLVANNDAAGTVSILLGNGDGTFQALRSYAVGPHPWRGNLGDLDADGKLDLVISTQSDNSVTVLFGNGDGTFDRQTEYDVGGPSQSATFGDFNADGRPDLAVANNIDGKIAILLQATTVTLSSTSLKFGVELVGTRSAAQTATLTNTGGSTLTISSITASEDFVQRNDCGSSVPAGASCTIRVAFNPSAKGVRTGRVTITDDAADSPQTIKLKGTGTVVQVSPLALDFGDQVVGTTSDPLTATITNISSEDLHISGIGLGGANFGDFAETTTCGSRLAAGGSCTIDVTFTPGARGHRHASLKIVDDGGASPQAVPLAGTGVPR